jgi:hypothetical protein
MKRNGEARHRWGGSALSVPICDNLWPFSAFFTRQSVSVAHFHEEFTTDGRISRMLQGGVAVASEGWTAWRALSAFAFLSVKSVKSVVCSLGCGWLRGPFCAFGWQIIASDFQCATYTSRRRFPIKPDQTKSSQIKLFSYASKRHSPDDPNGVLECWSIAELVKSSHPPLHHSITPFSSSAAIHPTAEKAGK